MVKGVDDLVLAEVLGILALILGVEAKGSVMFFCDPDQAKWTWSLLLRIGHTPRYPA